MKALNLGIAVTLASLAFTSHAETIRIAVPQVDMSKSTKTRAEVLADMHLWRLSGMADFNQTENNNVDTTRYEEAKARYDALRSSPAYADLVKQLEHNPRTNVARIR